MARDKWVIALRENIWPLALLLAAIFTAFVISAGISGHPPDWFVALATIL